MSDTGRLLLTVAVLSASLAGSFAWNVGRLDPAGPERLVGQLRLAQTAALLLAASGAISIGLAVANAGVPTGTVDVTFSVALVIVAAAALWREPRHALLLLAGGFVAHALVDIAHRPGLLSPALMPRGYAMGSAIYDVGLAAICYWGRRR